MLDNKIKGFASLCEKNSYMQSKAKRILSECEAIDKFILYIIYKNATELGSIVNNKIIERVSQAFRYTELREKADEYIELGDSTIYTCLNWLVSKGLIAEVIRADGREIYYAITEFGLYVVRIFG